MIYPYSHPHNSDKKKMAARQAPGGAPLPSDETVNNSLESVADGWDESNDDKYSNGNANKDEPEKFSVAAKVAVNVGIDLLEGGRDFTIKNADRSKSLAAAGIQLWADGNIILASALWSASVASTEAVVVEGIAKSAIAAHKLYTAMSGAISSRPAPSDHRDLS